MIGIYCITNKINGKKYFGQSIDIERRKKAYFNKGDFPNDHLKNAFNKYGKENFKFEIIKCCKEKYLDRFEKLYIRVHDTMNPNKGYNKESGGNLNKHLSNEVREKISKSISGENNPMYKQKHTPEARKKMSENHADFSGENHPMWRRKHTAETCKKISENHADLSLENHPLWKKYPRIIKAGLENGKQRYRIKYNGKVFMTSIYKERVIKKWYDEHPDIELIDETE